MFFKNLDEKIMVNIIFGFIAAVYVGYFIEVIREIKRGKNILVKLYVF